MSLFRGGRNQDYFIQNEIHAATFEKEIPQGLQNKNACIQLDWEETVATLAGTIKLQARVHPNAKWQDVADSSTTIALAGTGMIWNDTLTAFPYVNVVVTITTGEGKFNAWISDKFDA